MQDLYFKFDTKKRLDEINDELRKLKVEEKDLTDAWNNEKNINQDINKIKSEIEKIRAANSSKNTK